MVVIGLLKYGKRRKKKKKKIFLSSVLAIVIECYRRDKKVHYIMLS